MKPFETMYGIYLKCEVCGATIGGEQVTPAQQGIPTLTRWQGRELREAAAKRGWVFVLPNADYCPVHASAAGVGADTTSP